MANQAKNDLYSHSEQLNLPLSEPKPKGSKNRSTFTAPAPPQQAIPSNPPPIQVTKEELNQLRITTEQQIAEFSSTQKNNQETLLAKIKDLTIRQEDTNLDSERVFQRHQILFEEHKRRFDNCEMQIKDTNTSIQAFREVIAKAEQTVNKASLDIEHIRKTNRRVYWECIALICVLICIILFYNHTATSSSAVTSAFNKQESAVIQVQKEPLYNPSGALKRIAALEEEIQRLKMVEAHLEAQLDDHRHLIRTIYREMDRMGPKVFEGEWQSIQHNEISAERESTDGPNQ